MTASPTEDTEITDTDNASECNYQTEQSNSVYSEETAVKGLGIGAPDEVTVGLDESNKKKQKEVLDMNQYFLLRKEIYTNTLAPELKLNESKKREHKDLVVKNLFSILKIQFGATYIFTFVMIMAIFLSNILVISNETLEYMFDFLKFYITSILAELVAILFFIVKQVFDKSIVELFQNFDSNGDSKNSID